MGKASDNSKLAAAFGLGCHFDTHKAMDFLRTHIYGIYDYALGINCRFACRPFFVDYD
jgi:hypothetical protein